MSTASRSRVATAGKAPERAARGAVEPDGDFAQAIEVLDEVIHQKARLKIMPMLLALGEADFKLLKESLGLSDGNLSTHLALLAERGYVEIRKEFRGRKPHTTVLPTDKGRQAFNAYLDALERIIKAARR